MIDIPFNEGGKDIRTWSSSHPAFTMMTEEAKQNLLIDNDYYAKGHV
jgi:hypothetical protein